MTPPISSRVHKRTYILPDSRAVPHRCKSHTTTHITIHITLRHVRAGPDPVTHEPVPTIGHRSDAKPSKRAHDAMPKPPQRRHESMASPRPSEFATGRAEFKVGTPPMGEPVRCGMRRVQGQDCASGPGGSRCGRKKARQGGGNAEGEGFRKRPHLQTAGSHAQRTQSSRARTHTHKHTNQGHTHVKHTLHVTCAL